MKPFGAMYRGQCSRCPESIEVGDRVVYDDDDLVHDECAPSAPRRMPAICSKCDLAHAGECF